MKNDFINGAFCDQLYKPVARITEQRKEGIFSIFTVKIALPHFVPRQSDVSFSLSGSWQYRKVGQRVLTTDTLLLATHSEANRWQMNNVQGQFSMDSEQHHGYLTFTIDERQIMSIRDKNKQLDQAQKIGRNFLTYNLSLEYQHPAGLPICLTYPHIVIDDNKSAISFWRNQTEIDAFAMEQAAS
ncbi:hypothetical protein [Marinomonas sp. THO17]|uniref:hypothetical protein n=1 Tax=Marinomonas sp. THO17 TaxID=3149048 RepID=UPI00336BFEB7